MTEKIWFTQPQTLIDIEYEKIAESIDQSLKERRIEKMNEPEYYNKNGLSPNQAFQTGLISHEEYIGFLKGNIIKYIVRCDKKGQGTEDMLKAIHYCQLLKKEMQD